MTPIKQENTTKGRNTLVFYFKELFVSVMIGVLIALPIWSFVMRSFLVSGSSMYPTFNLTESAGYSDYLMVELLSYTFNEPQRGDVVVFKSTQNNETNEYLLKRLIGLPNERIVIEEKDIYIHTPFYTYRLDEPYLSQTDYTYRPYIIDLMDDEYFFVGDNRNNSNDSRSFGPVPKDNIVGKVFLRIFPFNDFKLFNKERDFSINEITVKK